MKTNENWPKKNNYSYQKPGSVASCSQNTCFLASCSARSLPAKPWWTVSASWSLPEWRQTTWINARTGARAECHRWSREGLDRWWANTVKITHINTASFISKCRKNLPDEWGRRESLKSKAAPRKAIPHSSHSLWRGTSWQQLELAKK